MGPETTPYADSSTKVLLGIALLISIYAVACFFSGPQHATQLIIEQEAHHEADHGFAPLHVEDHQTDSQPHAISQHLEHLGIPGIIWVTPFALLLLAIAVFPLLPATAHWWESNLHRFYIAAVLGAVTLGYYLIGFDRPLEAHWPAHAVISPISDATFQWELAWTVFANALLHEYIPFIVLLLSLYTISGGIRIEGNLAAHPLTNTSFLAVGGLLASFIGTTGAAMLLIRPLLDTNRERSHVVHTVVFFIFIVCNCGGCLLPIGDPPLFLGYLRGVDFFWTLTLWPQWLVVNAALLAVYWVWDQCFCYPREASHDLVRDKYEKRKMHIRGWGLGVPLLVGVVLCVALLDPSKPLPGTDWHAPLYLREVMQLFLVGLSLLLGQRGVRQDNAFSYHAILEVATLFFGIFLCMQPALQILDARGSEMGVESPMQFFWTTGGLSSVLDNAPTYVVFFETARTLTPEGVFHPETVVDPLLLVAISLGAVFLGAMTYIGNGPNFMVKAIAESAGIRMPSFFGYLKYSVFVLLPIFILVSLLFL
jgi:Na+/H+ antiporter NhaD/arsenite permease-like protein